MDVFSHSLQSKALIPLQTEAHPETKQRVLTNYMFPQQPRSDEGKTPAASGSEREFQREGEEGSAVAPQTRQAHRDIPGLAHRDESWYSQAVRLTFSDSHFHVGIF